MNPSAEESKYKWYSLSCDAVFSILNSTPAGLTGAEASRRLIEHGPNELQPANPISPLSIFFQQFKNVLIGILLAAATLSAFLGHEIEAIAIAVIVLFAVVLGCVQEYRSERAIEALRQMAAPSAMALRNGVEVETPARELVPGDVILLRTGNKIPADIRLIEAMNLQIEESALTGESVSVEKHTAPLDTEGLAIADRKNMGYAGTAVTYGRGRAVVVATGMNTEFGKIAQMIQTIETDKTPLQADLDRVGRMLARIASSIVAVIVFFGLLRGQPFIEILVFGIALAVAVVPEALPAVVTISLALGVRRMVKRNALCASHEISGLIAGATLLDLPMPLSAVQILYINLATDGLPTLALAVDPPEPDIMGRKPRDKRTGIFTRPVVALMTVAGLWSAAAILGLFAWLLNSGRSANEAMAITFVSLVLIEFTKAYHFRSGRHSVLNRPFANTWLNLAILWEILLLSLIIYLPILQQAFGTFDLGLADWLVAIGPSVTIFPVLEFTKWILRKGWLGDINLSCRLAY